ncbi:MAG: response regulator [Candidatus Omnitrophica bacterium]|nr:response regulator [Candidatus Omnitrophota bacterium]
MEKKKILLVDDEQEFTRNLKLDIEASGLYNVITENQASKAMSVIQKARPDLILLDVVMPGIMGPEIASRLKENPATAGIPVVFLTGNVLEEEVRDHAGIIGGYPFLAKPITGQQALNCIKKYLG